MPSSTSGMKTIATTCRMTQNITCNEWPCLTSQNKSSWCSPIPVAWELFDFEHASDLKKCSTLRECLESFESFSGQIRVKQKSKCAGVLNENRKKSIFMWMKSLRSKWKSGHEKSCPAYSRLASFISGTISVPSARGLTYRTAVKMLHILLPTCTRWACHMWVLVIICESSHWCNISYTECNWIAREHIPDDCIVIGLRHRSEEMQSVCAVDGSATRRVGLDFGLSDDDGSTCPFAAIQRKVSHDKGYTHRFVYLSRSPSGRLFDLQVSNSNTSDPVGIEEHINLVSISIPAQSDARPLWWRSTAAAATGAAFSESFQHKVRHNLPNCRNDDSQRSQCTH